MAYSLEMKSDGKRSDHGCDCKWSRGNIQSEVESGGKMLDHSCNGKGSTNDILPGGREERQEVRSQLQLQRKQR